MSDDYGKGFYSNVPSENFQSGSQEWAGAQAAERIKRREAEFWEDHNRRQQQLVKGQQQVAAGSSGPGGVVWLEGGILSGVALYRNWPQYLSLYSSFPQTNVLWEYGVAAGSVLVIAIFYLRFCIASKLFTWGSFIVIGAFLAAWSLPWSLNWRTCLAGFLVVMMFLDRRALRSW